MDVSIVCKRYENDFHLGTFKKAPGNILVHQDLAIDISYDHPTYFAQSVTCLATDASLTANPESRVRSQPGPILSWRLIMK